MQMSLERIAREAGTSVATVSRALNGKPGVSASKAHEIRSLVKKLNYAPSRRRRTLPASPQQASLLGKTIAVIALGEGHHLHPHPFARMVESISTALASRGVNLLVNMVRSVEDLPPAIVNRQVHGLLLMGTGCDEDVISILSGLPHVWLTSHTHPGATGDEVLAGNESAGRCAADYLIDAGHRRLTFINPMPGLGVFRRRMRGFVAAAEDAGAEVQVSTPEHLDPTMDLAGSPERLGEVLKPMVEQFVGDSQRATGLCVPSDMITAVLYPMLIRAGLHPGKDVTVISFDNEKQYLMGLDPRPATIDAGVDVIGLRATEQLLWRIENPMDDRPIQITIKPIVVGPGES